MKAKIERFYLDRDRIIGIFSFFNCFTGKLGNLGVNRLSPVREGAIFCLGEQCNVL